MVTEGSVRYKRRSYPLEQFCHVCADFGFHVLYERSRDTCRQEPVSAEEIKRELAEADAEVFHTPFTAR